MSKESKNTPNIPWYLCEDSLDNVFAGLENAYGQDFAREVTADLFNVSHDGVLVDYEGENMTKGMDLENIDFDRYSG